MSGQRPFREFLQDLAATLGVWLRRPALPLTSVGVGLLVWEFGRLLRGVTGYPDCLPDSCPFGGATGWVLTLVSIAVAVLVAGWFGTERIWYLRAFRAKPIEPSELVRLTNAFRERYLQLGLIILVVTFAAGFLSIVFGPLGVVFVAAFAFALDLGLTFVTPALAFSTGRLGTAVGIGLRLIRQRWPASAGYVLAPPFALLILRESVSGDLSTLESLLVAALLLLFNMWLKGAAVRFYLRHHEVGDDGSAYPPRAEEEAAQPEERPHPSAS